MSEKVNKFSLAGDKFMPEMHLRNPGFTYSAWVPFTKNRERITKIKETKDLWYIYQKKLDITCFQHDLAYGHFKDLNRRTFPGKVLFNKTFKIAKDPRYDGYQRGLASIIYKLFDKKNSASGIKNENISNKELAKESDKPMIRRFSKREVH